MCAEPTQLCGRVVVALARNDSATADVIFFSFPSYSISLLDFWCFLTVRMCVIILHVASDIQVHETRCTNTFLLVDSTKDANKGPVFEAHFGHCERAHAL